MRDGQLRVQVEEAHREEFRADLRTEGLGAPPQEQGTGEWLQIVAADGSPDLEDDALDAADRVFASFRQKHGPRSITVEGAHNR